MFTSDLPVIWQLMYLYGGSYVNLLYLAESEPYK